MTFDPMRTYWCIDTEQVGELDELRPNCVVMLVRAAYGPRTTTIHPSVFRDRWVLAPEEA